MSALKEPDKKSLPRKEAHLAVEGRQGSEEKYPSFFKAASFGRGGGGAISEHRNSEFGDKL